MSEEKACAVCGRVYRTEQDFLTRTTRWRVCTQGNLWFNCACGSTLMLRKGKYSWYSPEKVLGDEARTVFNRLGNLQDLPHIPNEVMEIQQLLQKADVTPKDVAHELRKEPVLATQVLQIAENLRCTRNPATPKIKALDHAIVYVGFKALGELILTSALKTLPLPKSGFDPDAFWAESYLTGAIAENLMHRFAPDLNPDEVFLAGALCNIGKLVLAFCFPPLATKICADVKKEPLVTWRQAEEAYGFPDHCILGEIASAMWGFPESTLNAARKHHTPSNGKSKKLDMADMAAIANQMCHWVLLRPHRIEEPLLKTFAERQGLSEAAMDKLALELSEMRSAIAGSAAPST